MRRIFGRIGSAAAFVVSFIAAPSHSWAVWDSINGIKTGSEPDVESSDPWTGPQLAASGGTLDFAGDAVVTNSVLLQEQSGWGDPIVNIGGAFFLDNPAATFYVLDGASFMVTDTSAGYVNVGFVYTNGTSHVALPDLSTHGDTAVVDPGTTLHVLVNYVQDGGHFHVVLDADFQTDGAFTLTNGTEFRVVEGSTFSVGNPGASSIETDNAFVNLGADVTVHDLTTHGDTGIANPGTSLHVLGDYVQTGGLFTVADHSQFQTGGRFTGSGLRDFRVQEDSTINIGNPAGSSIETEFAGLYGGADVTAFAHALRDPNTYFDEYGVEAADAGNCDGLYGLDFDDIDDFVALFPLGMVTVAQVIQAFRDAEKVPEPASFVLGLVAALMVIRRSAPHGQEALHKLK